VTVGGKQDNGLVRLDVGQLLGLKVRGIVVEPAMLERATGVAANIALGGVLGAVLVSDLSAEGTGRVTRSP